ncbi:uncharacterized protein LOC113130633 [Mastacembelus armatus]|uniref:uncharacterized protein LOC113130633 n=1 Tax=Mastacembelus armatus TaxID=205130 RepID=UPI000E45B759|nr:uncharacterized protein LOC113130633 [Mastacembelus armatus]
MLFSFSFLFILSKNTGFAAAVEVSYPQWTTHRSTSPVTTKENLKVVAIPDHPVAAGETVTLYCTAVTVPAFSTWPLVTWQRLENQTWQNVSTNRNLTLTEPEQSGPYRCWAQDQFFQKGISPSHTVRIFAMLPTVVESFGITAFVLSLLALIINLAIVLWLVWQRLGGTLTTSSTPAAKGFPGPEKATKGGLPQTGKEDDVYMNYTNTNQAYSDLDPTNMTADNVYSCLS